MLLAPFAPEPAPCGTFLAERDGDFEGIERELARLVRSRVDGGRGAAVGIGMNEHTKAKGAPLEHAGQLDRLQAYRSGFEDLLLTYLDIAPRRDRSGKRDGRRKAMQQALDGRASYFQIRDWRQGYRPAPAWARELIRAKIAKRQTAFARHLKSKTAGD